VLAQNLEPLVVVVGVVMEHHELANARDSGEHNGLFDTRMPPSQPRWILVNLVLRVVQ
jgi:hypothetical protein